ncbi:hypothetical protein BX285_4438 [Streptomyces sp. 1114.5]|uniref:hypothetical protein n=1 Tax=unclassified Streptomyces TaxID=2593676 RepID=UPI000BD480AD|nr:MULTISPECIES: hypothetical protein [unclassified Streptomyces]RKT19964.1 hypothetical protein BX285_4438 [Streptomyces sp. 1114.5]SOB86159.1 hypothetical protein SAMN06272789_6466 [Streptomyces sp. 1331.2]
MQLERVRPTVLRATFHAYELAALTAAARYVVEAAPPDIPAESLQQLEQLLAAYDDQVRNLQNPAPQGGA